MPADGRKNNGGARKGAGRKPKLDEIKKIELMDSVATPEEAWEKLWERCKEGDTNAIKYWVDQRFGKPKESVDVTSNGNDLNVNPIEWVTTREDK